MRFAIAQPCFGSSEMVLRIKRSSVPCTRSFGFAILWLSTVAIVDCQGMPLEVAEAPRRIRGGNRCRTRNQHKPDIKGYRKSVSQRRSLGCHRISPLGGGGYGRPAY